LDLTEFLRGAVATSPRLILALINRLPETSHYVIALSSAPVQSSDQPSEPLPVNPLAERMFWNEDRRLMAQLINSVNTLVRHTIQWGDKPPEIDLIGPSEWREAAKPKPKNLTVMGVLNRITGQHV
jgi:hypothetical protein